MSEDSRPIRFLNFLPQYFGANGQKGESLLGEFLAPLERVFEELEASIEGNALTIEVIRCHGKIIEVKEFCTGSMHFMKGSHVKDIEGKVYSKLSKELPANSTGLTRIEIEDDVSSYKLIPGDSIVVYTSGISDLFDMDISPPPEFRHSGDSERAYLDFLAGMLAIPLRDDKSTEWNRNFLKNATGLLRERHTASGLEKLLREWLKDDIIQTDLIMTDLTSHYNNSDALFQIGQTSTLGIDTVIGEGPPYFFIVDIVVDLKVKELRTIEGINALQRAAKFLIDTEKGANTYYQLRIRANTMQLAPNEGKAGEFHAQVGVNTLLWGDSWTIEGR